MVWWSPEHTPKSVLPAKPPLPSIGALLKFEIYSFKDLKCIVSVEGRTDYDRNGALTIRPPTNRPRDILTHTIRQPDKTSAVTFYYCDILSQGGRIVRPPKIVTFRPSKFGRFVTV